MSVERAPRDIGWFCWRPHAVTLPLNGLSFYNYRLRSAPVLFVRMLIEPGAGWRDIVLLKKPIAVLLASAASGGTIAAVRHLGANGFDVRVLSSQRFAAASWSRRTARTYSAPPESERRPFLSRLLAIGAADPGQVLLPTSDETAWLYTMYAAELGQYFRVAQPSIETLRRILDKKLFADAATSAGLTVLPSWDPRNIDDLAALAPTLPYPVLIKPRTHVHRLRNDKGVAVASAGELMDQYQRFLDREHDRAGDNPLLPDANLPILQQFVRVGGEGVYSVTGFIDRTGELFVTRHATKVFQRSRPVGVGVCFESLPADPGLSNAVRRLCRELGYFGIFEVEFLWFDGRWAAIDFNPRLFNQVGMDIRRGMSLPLFAFLDAAGETEALREAVAKAQAQDEGDKTVFCDRFTLRAILFAQAMTARISQKDRAYWRAWLKLHAAHAVDFAADDNDPMPGIIHALSEIHLGLKAFPRFMRSTPRVSPSTARILTQGRS
jgi:D-aspartate ligase